MNILLHCITSAALMDWKKGYYRMICSLIAGERKDSAPHDHFVMAIKKYKLNKKYKVNWKLASKLHWMILRAVGNPIGKEKGTNVIHFAVSYRHTIISSHISANLHVARWYCRNLKWWWWSAASSFYQPLHCSASSLPLYIYFYCPFMHVHRTVPDRKENWERYH